MPKCKVEKLVDAERLVILSIKMLNLIILYGKPFFGHNVLDEVNCHTFV